MELKPATHEKRCIPGRKKVWSRWEDSWQYQRTGWKASSSNVQSGIEDCK